MDIVIRRMQAADLPRVVELLGQWNMAPIVPTRELPVPERSELAVDNAHVALDGERIIGVCSFLLHSPTLAEGASFAVAPGYHRAGIGERLLQASLRQRHAMGIRRVRCEADRPETIRWLVERMGYRIVGTHPKRHSFSSPEIDRWTVLERDLSQPPD